MRYTLTVRIRRAEGEPAAEAVAAWERALNACLSPGSRPFRFEDTDGAFEAFAWPGNFVDLNAVIDACVALRASGPELQVTLTDSFDNELMPAPTSARPAPPMELRWAPDKLEVLVGPVDEGKPPHLLVDFGGGRTTTATPLWKTGDRWVYQVWLLGELEGVQDATVELVGT